MRRNPRADAPSSKVKPSVALISLGCSKNLVDSELMLASLAESGFVPHGSAGQADVVVVNTCSFLRSARQEAAECIEDVVRLKRSGKLRGVVVAGCLPALKGESLFEEFPEIGAIVGPRDRRKVVDACRAALNGQERRRSFLACSDSLVRGVYPRAISTGSHTSYLKIAEGCDNGCSYCLIPSIRGRMVSRTVGSILREAALLAETGISELCLIAQDTTSYGRDLYGRTELGKLLRRLSRIDGPRWIRLLYTHPAHWSDELLKVIAQSPKVCRYVDVPIQHASDRILRLMKRGTSQTKLASLFCKFRRAVPGISLRTTVIVGFPGERESDFSELLEFVRHFQFDHLGTFVYSKETGTRAARCRGHVPEEVKEDRLRRIMEAQREISAARNRAAVGKEVTVLLESVHDDGNRAVGRTEGQAPEVDGVVRVRGERLSTGRFVRVRITDATAYDLAGEVRSSIGNGHD
ncbi:MAG: 30S ribosomal protein S12 methylthiotransferase RimO [Candidatus Eiseniibacteriota bacterium]|nr:MAG: 30S ribosomal protein S12 methylthiotransferase RimO [Candidatus Eisenbacteria bacterium]